MTSRVVEAVTSGLPGRRAGGLEAGRGGGRRKEGSWEEASERGREAFTWAAARARRAAAAPPPAAMDESALYIVRAGEAGSYRAGPEGLQR